jgi:hypothetical protein
MAIIQGTSKASSGSYQIDQSIRFNDDDSAYMSRTPASAGDRQTWTWSGWVKRGNLGSWKIFFGAWDGTSGNDTTRLDLAFETADTISITGGVTVFRNSTQVFRDSSAWYHIVVVADTTNATTQNRLRIYVNGVEITNWGTNNTVTQNTSLAINNNASHVIGAKGNSPAQYFDGYMAEINFIDGQALAPIDFGEYNDDGVWIAKRFAGAYGSNGFHITGEDSAALGTDYSGNGNDFTSSGLTSADQVTDTPTDNYATYLPLYGAVSYPATFSDGNLQCSASGAAGRGAVASIAPTTGKWYGEFTVVAIGTASLCRVGVVGIENLYDPLMFSAGEYAPQLNNVLYFGNGTLRTYVPSYLDTPSWGSTFTTTDIIGVAYDADTGKVWFAKNNTWQSSGDPANGLSPAVTLLITGVPFYFQTQIFDNTMAANFGQRGFTYTPPTGFKALSTANLPAPAIKDGSAYFQPTLYTGNGTAIGSGGNAVTQIGNSTFQPDFVWMKSRSAATDHALYDAVRGTTKELITNSSAAESTLTEGLTTFGAAGFTVGNDAAVNTNAATYAAWQWKANGAGVANTDGTISSTVSVNQTAGFSIVRAASMAASGTIGHGLSQAPDMVIGRMQSEVYFWWTWHQGLSGGTYVIKLNDTSAQAAVATVYTAEPTSTVINTGGSWTSGNPAIFYCFHEVEGFSKFGSYTGNGSSTDGPFIWCGFRPAFVMFKKTSATDSWEIFDNTRPGYNATGLGIYPNTTDSELTGRNIDILSNGIKQRNANGTTNESGQTYIFMAFAENPFGGDGVAPATAR